MGKTVKKKENIEKTVGAILSGLAEAFGVSCEDFLAGHVRFFNKDAYGVTLLSDHCLAAIVEADLVANGELSSSATKIAFNELARRS